MRRPDMTDQVFTVPCKSCGAIAGEQCRNSVTKGPLIRFLAHPRRLVDAGRK